MDNTRRVVKTGLGNIDLKEYLEIRAIDSDFGSYAEAFSHGFRVKGYEDVTPESLG